MKNKILWIISSLVGVLFITSYSLTGSSVSDEMIKSPLSEITTTASFFTFNADVATIKYFAVKSKDGSVKTAFDACDVCGYAKKGYKQEGDSMICNNCGNRYPISGLGTANKNPGGCWPGYLPSRVEGDDLIIKTSDLKKGEYKFK